MVRRVKVTRALSTTEAREPRGERGHYFFLIPMTPPARWTNLLRVHSVTGYTLCVDDLDLSAVEEPDLTKVDTFVLHAELRRLDGQLAAMGEILKKDPSPEARELHSRRGAIVIILKNRKAL